MSLAGAQEMVPPDMGTADGCFPSTPRTGQTPKEKAFNKGEKKAFGVTCREHAEKQDFQNKERYVFMNNQKEGC